MTERRVFAMIIAAIIPVAAGFCQSPQTPPKPLRERLLARALKGDAEAQFDLAKGYEGGRMGLPQDLSEARHWYREAADQGDPFAEASLGLLLCFGKGGARDYFQAYIMYERAASHLAEGGDRDTIVEMRDSLVRKLTDQQLVEARRLAKEWKPALKQ